MDKRPYFNKFEKEQRKNSIIIKTAEKIKSALKYLGGIEAQIFYDDVMKQTTPTINIKCLTYDIARKSASIFSRVYLDERLHPSLVVNSTCENIYFILFGCSARINENPEHRVNTDDILFFEVMFHAEEAKIFGDLESPLRQTYDASNSLEFASKYGNEEINSANLSVLSEKILKELNIHHSPQLVLTNLMGALYKAEINNIGKAYDLISGEAQELFDRYTNPDDSIVTSLSSIYMFSLAVRHPKANSWVEIFPDSSARPIFMSKSFATGLASKHGRKKFLQFARDHNFRIVN